MPVRFELDNYSKAIWYVYWEGEWTKIAAIIRCPRGFALRWYHLASDAPGATEYADTLDEAKEIAKQWASGLEIEPCE